MHSVVVKIKVEPIIMKEHWSDVCYILWVFLTRLKTVKEISKPNDN